MEYPSSDEFQASDQGFVNETEFFSPTLDERLRSDEAFLRQAVDPPENRRSEAQQLHHAHDESERLAALEANRRHTRRQTQDRNEREQKLLTEIEALRNAEAHQRQRIEEASASGGQSQEAGRTESEPACVAEEWYDADLAPLPEPEAIHVDAQYEAEDLATERQQLNAEIKNLGQAATQQIDRMEEAKSRLNILEQIRVHAEKMVYERALREMQLQAEINALNQAEAAQLERIEEAEAEARRISEKQTCAQEEAEARLKAEVEARQLAAAEAMQRLEEEERRLAEEHGQLQEALEIRRQAAAVARQQAEAEALQQADDDARRLAEEEEKGLEHLETIRARAEAASQERSEKEARLNTQLLAFGEAATEQLKRIERAEAELCEAERALQQLEEKAQQATDHLANRLAENEERRKAAEEERARAEAESHALIETEERRLADLESTLANARVEAEKLAAAEQKLNADLESLAEVEASQHRRLVEARAEVQRLSEEESHLRRIAEEEEERIIELEALRNQAATKVQDRREEEQQLIAEIEALNQAEAAQLERIEEAEAEARRISGKQTCLQEQAEARLKAEAEARQLAAAEAMQQLEEEERQLAEEHGQLQEALEIRRQAAAVARQQAEAEALQQADDDARRLAEEEEKGLEHLETIRARAEAASQERSEKEARLNTQLLAFGEAAAEQLKRIERAEAALCEAEHALQQLEEKAQQVTDHLANRLTENEERRKAAEEERARAEAESHALAETEERPQLSEEESHLRRIAEEEEERIIKLEALRNQATTKVQDRGEEEQQLIAEIEALEHTAAEQLSRIAAAEVTLFAHEEELPSGEAGSHEEEGDAQTETSRDLGEDTQGVSESLPLESDETHFLWSDADNNGHSSDTSQEEVALGSDHSSASSEIVDFETTTPDNLAGDERESIETFITEESVDDDCEETLTAAPLSERLRTDDSAERAKAFQDLTRLDPNDAFNVITRLFDERSEDVRNAAARALYDLNPSRAEAFTRALREGAPERRRQIIRALDCSGLAAEAIESLAGESREKTYDAFSLLFLMAKAGEVQTLLQTIEKHSNSAVRLSVIKLLTFSNRPDIIPALRSLAVRGALPIEVRSALMESIYEISSNARERALSAA